MFTDIMVPAGFSLIVSILFALVCLGGMGYFFFQTKRGTAFLNRYFRSKVKWESKVISAMEKPYNLLSSSEQRFFSSLQLILANDFLICPKVQVAEIFHVPESDRTDLEMTDWAAKPIDFVICDRRVCGIIGAIELDDVPHQSIKDKENADRVNKLFHAAGIPLLHIPIQPSYDLQLLADKVVEGLFSTENRLSRSAAQH